MLFSSSGSPQGCVLSPVLYILYTDDCRSSHPGRHILKFAVIVSLLQREDTAPGPVVDDFTEWCDNSFLKLNVTKTKDVSIDFRKKSRPLILTVTKRKTVERVPTYKYLGIVIDNKLPFNENTDVVCKKAQQWMHFLRTLDRFGVCSKLMTLFYHSMVESVLTFATITWFGSSQWEIKKRLEHIVKVASKITGLKLRDLSQTFYKRVTSKAQHIVLSILCVLNVSSSPLGGDLGYQRSNPTGWKIPLSLKL